MMTRLWLLLVAASQIACQTVHSYKYDSAKLAATFSRQDGVVYALPMNLVQVHAWSGRDEERIAALTAKIKKGNADLASAKKSIADLQKKIAASDAATAKKLGAEVTRLQASVKALEESLKKLADEKGEAEELRHRITLEVLPAVADPDHTYVAVPSHSWLREDDLDIDLTPRDEKAVTGSPLLRSVTVVAEDKTGEVILNLAKAYLRLSTGMGPGETRDVRGMAVVVDEYDYLRTFDPLDVKTRTSVAGELHGLRGYSLYVRDMKGESAQRGASVEVKDGVAGIVYRQTKPYVLGVHDSGHKMHKSVQVALPNDGPIGVLPFESGAFVTNEYSAGFVDGRLMKAEAKRGSEALGFSLLPLRLAEEVVGAATGAVSDVVQLKVDTTAPAGTTGSEGGVGQTSTSQEMDRAIAPGTAK